MNKKLFFILFGPFVFAQAPGGYYNGIENLNGYQLKSKLKEIISTKNINWHYDDLKTYFGQTDIDKYYENDGSLLDIYSEIPNEVDAYNYDITQIISSANAEGLGWNREHAMPQSTYDSYYPMYSDLMYVIPTDARINQLRNNYPYGVIKNGGKIYYTFTNGSRIGDSGIPNSGYTNRVYEPINEFKGDIARMLLYFVVRYEDKLASFKYNTSVIPSSDRNPLDGTEEQGFEKSYIDMLLSWNELDPVSQREIDRNNEIYKIQNNRNPFIDQPELASKIWNQTLATIAPSIVSNVSIIKNSAYFTTINWDNSSADAIGYEVYVDGTLFKKTKNTSLTISHLSPSTTYNVTVVAYNNAYLKSNSSIPLNFTTLEKDNFANDLMITKYIEGSENNRALEITNNTGFDVDLNEYNIGIQTINYSSGSYYFDNGLQLEGILKQGEKLVVMNPNAKLSCFDTKNANIISASPALNFTGTKYLNFRYKNTTLESIGVMGQENQNNDVSLYRNNTVTNPNATFDINEWESHPQNYCEGLGETLKVQNINWVETILMYPNPTFDYVYLKGLETKVFKNVVILDSLGRVVQTIKNVQSGEPINIQNLSSGIYFVVIDGLSYKLIKK